MTIVKEHIIEEEPALNRVRYQLLWEKIAKESWGKEIIDWRDEEQRKAHLVYFHNHDMLAALHDKNVETQGSIYFKTKESIEEAITVVGEENVKKYIMCL